MISTMCCAVLSHVSSVWLFVTHGQRPHATQQAPLSMGFSRQEYWSGLHAHLQGIFLTKGLNQHLFPLLYWRVGSLPLVPPGKPDKCYNKKQKLVDMQSNQASFFCECMYYPKVFPGGSVVKNSPVNAGLIPGLGRFPGKRSGKQL